MNTLLTRYLQRQMISGVDVMRSKARDLSGKDLTTRTIIVTMQKYVRDFLEQKPGAKRWIVMPGLRGVGKTTTMAQQYLQIHNEVGERVHLLYVSLDEVVEKIGSNLADLLDEYERLAADGSFESNAKPVFLFIDEVQVDEKWARTLKFLYDRVPNIFILCSGSSATHLQIDADVDGRRATLEKLYPLSFPEYQLILNNVYPKKGLKSNILNVLYYSKNATAVYEGLLDLQNDVDRQWSRYAHSSVQRYLDTGTIPFTLHETDQRQVYSAINAMIDKIISLDMQALNQFTSETIGAMKRLLMILSDCDVITLRELERTIGVSRSHIINMIDAFIKAELLIKIPAHGSNITATTNPPKYYFMSPALRASYHDIVGVPGTADTRRGMLLEDAFALHFYREFMSKRAGSVTQPFNKKGGMCDFIVRIDSSRQIPIEVGLGNKGYDQVEKTLSKTGGDYGLVFSSSPLSISQDKSIVRVPLDYFFLM